MQSWQGALEGSRPLPTGPTVKGCRGEQCSPGELGGSARPRGRAMLAPTAAAQSWLPFEGSSRRQAGEGWSQEHEPHPATPQSPAVTAPLKGSHSLHLLFWPWRGQCGEKRKSVKKNAALLRFLAFLLLDLLFGVLRGEQPLSRASRAVGSSGHFFRFLFGCPKRKNLRT